MKKALTLILVLLSFELFAQSKTDSLIALLPQLSDSSRIHVLNTIALQLSFKDIAKSQQYAEQALEVSRTTNYKKGEAESLCTMCSILGQKGQYAQGLDLCQSAQAIYISSADKKGQADVYNRIGSIYSLQGEYSMAVEYFFKSLKLRQELHQKIEATLVVENIGIVYFRQGDYKLALDYFKESYESYKEQGNEASASKILVNLGATYNRLKLPAKALEANLLSLTYFEKLNNSTGVGIANNNVGNVYIEMKDYRKAISYYEKSLAIKIKMNDKRGMAVSYRNLAEAHLGLGDLAKAKTNIDQSLKIAEEIGAKEQIKDAYLILSQMFEKAKNYEEALIYEKKSAQAKDSLFSSEKSEQISRMRAIYETEKAERETEIAKVQATFELEKKDVAIALLNKDNKIKATERNFLIAIVASLLMMSLLILYFFRQKQKSNDLLTEKNTTIEKSLHERETLLKEIHHRVKNNLQIISSLLSLQSKNTNDVATQGAISESRNRVKSMSLIHEQLYQEDTISGVEMMDYITRLVNSLCSSYGLDRDKIKIEIEAENILLDVDSAIPLGLIINELVSNSMKYAFPDHRSGSILIFLKDKIHELQLVVQDDGVGMDTAKNTSQSFGLNLVNSLMRKLKAEIMIASNAGLSAGGPGTSVQLTIKDFKKITLA